MDPIEQEQPTLEQVKFGIHEALYKISIRLINQFQKEKDPYHEDAEDYTALQVFEDDIRQACLNIKWCPENGSQNYGTFKKFLLQFQRYCEGNASDYSEVRTAEKLKRIQDALLSNVKNVLWQNDKIGQNLIQQFVDNLGQLDSARERQKKSRDANYRRKRKPKTLPSTEQVIAKYKKILCNQSCRKYKRSPVRVVQIGKHYERNDPNDSVHQKTQPPIQPNPLTNTQTDNNSQPDNPFSMAESPFSFWSYPLPSPDYQDPEWLDRVLNEGKSDDVADEFINGL